MNKNEWLWVSIRVTGLVFLVMAVAAVPDAISGSYAVIQYGSLPPEVAGSAFENVIKAGKAMACKVGMPGFPVHNIWHIPN
jgi:hypothetical protein